MNPGRLFFVSKQVTLFALAFGITVLPSTKHGVAQERTATSTLRTAVATHAHSDSAADNDYSKKIKEYTTETYFMTELVDHLPMSDRVPSPRRFSVTL